MLKTITGIFAALAVFISSTTTFAGGDPVWIKKATINIWDANVIECSEAGHSSGNHTQHPNSANWGVSSTTWTNSPCVQINETNTWQGNPSYFVNLESLWRLHDITWYDMIWTGCEGTVWYPFVHALNLPPMGQPRSFGNTTCSETERINVVIVGADSGVYGEIPPQFCENPDSYIAEVTWAICEGWGEYEHVCRHYKLTIQCMYDGEK